ncbi:uncharacterized protein DDB_G0286591-like [Battus philenor]|uniref:uncharacterized protein DDB_G0286591-like n=1 Tax=Battus philenor TaxID=42288 RepID=UPI0035D1231A
MLNSFKVYLLFNFFFSQINLGLLEDVKASLNSSASIKRIPLEIKSQESRMQSDFQDDTGEIRDSNACNFMNNVKFRLPDRVEQKWTPIIRPKPRKPNEPLNINLNELKKNYTRKLIYLNNTDNINSSTLHENRQFENGVDLSKNDSMPSPNQQANTSFIFDSNHDEVLYFEETKNKSEPVTEDINLEIILDKTGRNDFNSKIRKLPDNEITKEDIVEKLNYVTKNTHHQSDTSVNSDANDSIGYDDVENTNIKNQAGYKKIAYNKENDDTEEYSFIENSGLQSSDFNERLDSRKGNELIEVTSDSNVLLIESSRICYACSSSSDASCLKPNRQTTVKYCHKNNEACIVKRYSIGRTNYLIRDCGSYCKHSDIFGLAIKYESCSVCHFDLCNSAYVINISYIFCFFVVAVLKIIH